MFHADMILKSNTVRTLPYTISISSQRTYGEGDSPVDVSFKIRHTDTFMKGTLTRGNGLFQIHSHEPLQGIAPGQFGVLYDKDAEICVGSGEIILP